MSNPLEVDTTFNETTTAQAVLRDIHWVADVFQDDSFGNYLIGDPE